MKALAAAPDQALESLIRILAKRTGQPIPMEREGLRIWLEARPADWAWAVATRPHLVIPAGIADCPTPDVLQRLRSASLPLDHRSTFFWKLLCHLEAVGADEVKRYLADMPGHAEALLELLEGE